MSNTSDMLMNFLLQGFAVFTIFTDIFKFLLDVYVRWKVVIIVAWLTVALSLVGRFAWQLYFPFSKPGAQSGFVATSLTVILVWDHHAA